MKKFEMPKMSVAVFSKENVVTASSGTTQQTNQAKAIAALGGADINNPAVATTANGWIEA